MPQTSLIRSTSFRLAANYLLLFTLSVLLLGLFLYASVRNEIGHDFDARIVEESESLQSDFAKHGLEWLQDAIVAHGVGGGGLTYGLKDAHGKPFAGDLTDGGYSDEDVRAGWIEMREDQSEERGDGPPEIVRALFTRLADGSILVVGDEQRRSTGVMRAIFWVFVWALAATLGLGTLGGLYSSSLFLRRIEAMSQTARGIMAGDWRRRIPESKANDELSAVARTFNRMFDRIEKLLEANKHVSADIAHDLRKPLARTLRRLEAARGDDAAPEIAKAAIETGIADIQGVLETFNALLRIGQIEAGARRAAFKPLDLTEIAGEVADAFRPAAEEEGKTLVARLETPLPMSGDRELRTQMIANLVDNALRHTPKGIVIEVASERGAGGTQFIVADNGTGGAVAERERIFERFYRVDAARATPGSGLGLSLVAAIAELHGLNCKASDNGPGLRVTIDLV
ncbi:MAG: HAMP domain-containing histidine kinase [Bradyrhizobium sp.]|nr:MAG: HAMP domain-containing histidine kinase [Bradyrhizobium sp.]